MAKLKMSDYIDRDVRLLCELTTHGGEVFRCGEILRGESHWRGRLTLCDPDNRGRRISHVHRACVQLLDLPVPKPVRRTRPRTIVMKMEEPET